MNTCKCYKLPDEGEFIVDNTYSWKYAMEAIEVTDEKAKKIYFDEYKFLWYFRKL